MRPKQGFTFAVILFVLSVLLFYQASHTAWRTATPDANTPERLAHLQNWFLIWTMLSGACLVVSISLAVLSILHLKRNRSGKGFPG